MDIENPNNEALLNALNKLNPNLEHDKELIKKSAPILEHIEETITNAIRDMKYRIFQLSPEFLAFSSTCAIGNYVHAEDIITSFKCIEYDIPSDLALIHLAGLDIANRIALGAYGADNPDNDDHVTIQYSVTEDYSLKVEYLGPKLFKQEYKTDEIYHIS